ncbi:hypothetical protein [Streptomyces sp. NPDC058664]|uniref:hypothetical protein n=1 Tax=unclassified Streptomyces TaxID=2593676 RepID=UPI00365C4F96
MQFARRDFRHRAGLGSFAEGSRARRLSVPLPDGRVTLIREARVADAARSRRRVEVALRGQYQTGPARPRLPERLGPVL